MAKCELEQKHQLKGCYGTSEWSENSGICGRCKLKNDCGRIRKSKMNNWKLIFYITIPKNHSKNARVAWIKTKIPVKKAKNLWYLNTSFLNLCIATPELIVANKEIIVNIPKKTVRGIANIILFYNYLCFHWRMWWYCSGLQTHNIYKLILYTIFMPSSHSGIAVDC